ncbi:MAG: cyclase family protein [Pseudomonadota bacterium]
MSGCIHDHSGYALERWGEGDQLGAGNLLTAERRLAAMQAVRSGELIDLGHVIENGAPRMPPNQTPFVMTLSIRGDNTVRRRRKMGATNDAGTSLERIEMTTHVGTHVDALGHVTIGDELYGGRHVDDELDDLGLASIGVEHVPPMITRGRLLDVSALDGATTLEAGRVVSADDLARAEEADGVEVAEGDVVCIHTGWGQWYMRDNDRYAAGEPGIDEPAARWLTERGVVAIASDNMAVEVIPNPRHPAAILPVHQHTLAEAGVYLIENLKTDELAAAGHRAFCFMLLATKFKGATGCPVRPVAVV